MTQATGSPFLVVDGLEGSLEALLELARTQPPEGQTLSVLAIVEGLGRALEAALAGSPARADLALWAEWLGMAAHLALWRSRLLLPPESEQRQAALETAATTQRAALEREAIVRVEGWLQARPQLGRQVFARGGAEAAGGMVAVCDVTGLFQACLIVLRVAARERRHVTPPPPLWRPSDAAARIGHLLRERGEGGALASFLPQVEGELQSRAAVASTLLAGLELCRTGAVALEQAASFAPLALSARPG